MDRAPRFCTRGKPACDKCPVADTCVARREGRCAELPTPKARKAVPERETAMLVLQWNGAYLLQQRPEPGIWGGLWSCPNSTRPAIPARRPASWAWNRNGTARWPRSRIPSRTTGRISGRGGWKCSAALREGGPPSRWVPADELATTALPAPVKKLLTGLAQANSAEVGCSKPGR